MIKILLLASILIFISASFGLILKNKFNFQYKFSGIVFGFIFYLFLLQLFYYPIQIFSLNSNWIMTSSLIVSLIGLVYGVFKFRDLAKEYIKIGNLWIVISFMFFMILFYNLSVSMEISDSQVYLNFIAQNIKIENLNQFDFWTGKAMKANEIFYLFQGYYHFGSFLCWVINIPYVVFGIGGFVENIATSTWCLGILYNVVFTSFVLEVVEYFNFKNKILKFSVISFLLFFFNAYYWRLAFAFYGNTYRTLIVGVLLYMLYRKYKDNDSWSIWLLTLPVSAGLATSSSFLFISFNLLFTLAIYLFIYRIGNPFKDMAIIVFPIVIYTIAIISTGSIILAFIIFIILVLGYYLLVSSKLDGLVTIINNFLSKHAKLIFFIVVPLFLFIYSAYLNLDEWYLSNYKHYFNNHAEYDMFVNPFGMYSNTIEIIWTLVRWSAIVILLINYKKNRFIAFELIVCFLIFLTPLSTPAIAKLYSDFVYYRAFDILFNPFTEILYLYVLYRYIPFKKIYTIIICVLIYISILLMNGPILFDYHNYSSYSNLYLQGQNSDPIFKITEEEYSLLSNLRTYEILPTDEDLTVISHAEGLKTFFPSYYQIFSRRQFFDVSSRVNEEFYQIAKRHYGWLEEHPVDYTNTCNYIKEFKVDVAIVNFYENWDFDQATDKCMNTIYEYGNFRVKELINE